MRIERSSQKLSKGYEEDGRVAGLREEWERSLGFLKRNYPAFLMGVILTGATVFSILSFKSRRGKETFLASSSSILGEKAGTVSAVATSSAASVSPTLAPTLAKTTSAGTKTSSQVNYPININQAGLATLDLLPGIGPSLAQKIIDFRTVHGPGEKKLEKIKGLVTVGPP